MTSISLRFYRCSEMEVVQEVDKATLYSKSYLLLQKQNKTMKKMIMSSIFMSRSHRAMKSKTITTKLCAKDRLRLKFKDSSRQTGQQEWLLKLFFQTHLDKEWESKRSDQMQIDRLCLENLLDLLAIQLLFRTPDQILRRQELTLGWSPDLWRWASLGQCAKLL